MNLDNLCRLGRAAEQDMGRRVVVFAIRAAGSLLGTAQRGIRQDIGAPRGADSQAEVRSVPVQRFRSGSALCYGLPLPTRDSVGRGKPSGAAKVSGVPPIVGPRNVARNAGNRFPMSSMSAS
jgi:hypothetical protein